jgi:predicted CXXCH cytochrome family protein
LLCNSCHSITNWTTSRHNTSTATWNNNGTNPWQHTPYTTVAKNGCENCHTPHNAGGPDRLMNYSVEETNCLNCHNGSVAAASKNIQAQFNKTYRHRVADYLGTATHTPNENILPPQKHAECADCHNPHQSDNSTAAAPNVSGKLKGVRGVDTDGKLVQIAQYEYQICYRCHTTSNWKPASATPRKIAQDNVALEFDANAISFHPIEAVGKSTSVPSLISPWTVSSMMYCTDCHSSDTTSSVNPRGPHGSTWPGLLQLRYETTDNTSYSEAAYALCFKCHSSSSIMNESSQFKYHKKHIQDYKTPCNVCHDSHGISQTQGNATNNAHLINFNTNVVTPYNGTLVFVQTTPGHGYCTLNCHTKIHNKKPY